MNTPSFSFLDPLSAILGVASAAVDAGKDAANRTDAQATPEPTAAPETLIPGVPDVLTYLGGLALAAVALKKVL